MWIEQLINMKDEQGYINQNYFVIMKKDIVIMKKKFCYNELS